MESKNEKGGATGLSKSVLSMKFMKKKFEIQQKEQQEKQLLQQLQNNDWLTTSTKNPPFPSSSSTTSATRDHLQNGKQSNPLRCIRETLDLYSTLPGRRSFNGCNKAIERHYQQMIDEKFVQYYQKMEVVKELKGAKDAGEGDDGHLSIIREQMIKSEGDIDYSKLISLPRGPNQGKRAAEDRPNFEQKKKQKWSNPRNVTVPEDDPSSASPPTTSTTTKSMNEVIAANPAQNKIKYELIRKKEIRNKLQQLKQNK